MKRKLKYILIVLGLLVLSVGGYALYIFKFKEYDVADPEIDKLKEETYTVTLPDGTELVLDGEGNVVQKDNKVASADPIDNEGTSEGNPETLEEPSSEEAPMPSLNESSQEKPTVASIKELYRPTLTMLEGQAMGKINALIGQAKSEYVTKKENGEKINYAYFYQKYMGAAESVEANTDAAFETVLAQVKKDLVANGFNESYAESLREEYEAKKEERRSSLLKKATNF